MFLFRMHSVGSIRPRLSVSDAIGRLCENNKVSNDVAESTPSMSVPSEIEEDVVIIEEEEMILVRKESPIPSPVREAVAQEAVAQEAVAQEAVAQEAVAQEAPEPKCIEPEPTVSAPSKSKPKKKQQKRR